jgi:hypothetical protein
MFDLYAIGNFYLNLYVENKDLNEVIVDAQKEVDKLVGKEIEIMEYKTFDGGWNASRRTKVIPTAYKLLNYRYLGGGYNSSFSYVQLCFGPVYTLPSEEKKNETWRDRQPLF